MARRISPTLLDLPDKYFFTIGEVSHLTWVKPHTLRHWETQFKSLRPARRESGQRKYTRRDIDVIRRIRKLVFEQKLTLEGARRQLTKELKARGAGAVSLPGSSSTLMEEIKREIQDIARELSGVEKR